MADMAEQQHRHDAHIHEDEATVLKRNLAIVVAALFTALAVIVVVVLVNLNLSRDLQHLSESQARLLACISMVDEPRPTDVVQDCLELSGFHVEVVRQTERIVEHVEENGSREP